MSQDKDGLDGLGDKLKELLIREGALPPGVKIDDVRVLGIPSSRKSSTPRPATLANLQGLLRGAAQDKFKIGDIVVLRPWGEAHVTFPKIDEHCIVTQVLDVPYRVGEFGTPDNGRPLDMAIAFIDPRDGSVVEFLQDSRMFEKVGSIYDPITTADGETLATE